MLTTLAALAALGAPTDVEWTLWRPSNTGVPGDYTHTIFIDDKNRPWVCGYIPFWEEGGVGMFDGEKWHVLSNVECPQITSPRFNDIVQTDDGVMWIGSDTGLLRFDPSVEPWCVERFHSGNSPLDGNQITDLNLAPDGTIWIANAAVGGSSAGGLGHYDPATDTWEFWNTSNGLPWWAGWDWVTYVNTTPDGNGGYIVWFGSSEMGLTSYQQGLFTWYGSSTPPDVHPLPTGVPGHNPADDQGNLWMNTDEGLARRNADGTFLVVGTPSGVGGSTISRVETISGGRALLGTYYADVFLWDNGWTYLGDWGSDNHTYALVEDQEGAFWAGGIGGASVYDGGFWQRRRLTNSGMISFFIEALTMAPNGDVAMNGNAGPGTGGFDILHPDGTWTNANAANAGIGLPWPFPTDDVTALHYRANGNLLFAPMFNGLQEYDGETYETWLGNGWDVEHISEDSTGRMWASNGRGVLWLEDNGGLIQFGYADGVPGGDLCGIEPAPQYPGSVWVGGQFGLARTDGTDWFIVPREAIGLTLDSIGYHITGFDVLEDGTLWIASGRGVFHYDPATGEYDQYDTTNSPLPSDDVFEVEVAPDQTVWISMFDNVFPYPGGVANFDGSTWTVYRQGSSPLPHNQVWDLESRAVEGGYELWIGTASEAVATIFVPRGCPADLNDDGLLDVFDILFFIGLLDQNHPSSDWNGDTVIDVFDVFAYLGEFEAGCN